MSYSRCLDCSGTGFVKNENVLFCKNNTLKLSYHLCYLCENLKVKTNSKYIICNTCYGDGSINKKSLNIPLSS